MKLDNFCSLGASLQTQTYENKEQPKLFYYRSTEDTIAEMLATGYFNPLYRRVNAGDQILLYSTKGYREYVFAKVVRNLNGIVEVETSIMSAEDIFVNPEWSHLLPETITATNLKDYLSAIEDSLNSKQNQLTAGRSIILSSTESGEEISVDVDDELDNESENPVSNEVVTNKFTEIQNEIIDVSSKTFTFKGYVGETEPSGGIYNTGDMWINSATMPTTIPISSSDIKIYNGTVWENATESYVPAVFDTFSNMENKEGYYWFGGDWKIISTDLSLSYFTLNTATGKWEIKTGVELNAPELVASPSVSATGHEIVDANWVVNQSSKEGTKYMTNCITEIPQDIKIELENGVLTLKEGSKLYKGNGDYFVTTQDYTTTATNAEGVVFFDIDNDALAWRLKTECYSQSSAPTTSQNMLWFDTEHNSVNVTADSGNTWTLGSLPICEFTANSTQITSINKVFNGFGYIGSTLFVLPGVKGLMANGRNIDGTPKNTNLEVTNVFYVTRTWNSNDNQVWVLSGNNSSWIPTFYIVSETMPATNAYTVWYQPSTNLMYENNTSSSVSEMSVVQNRLFITDIGVGTNISLFSPKQVFQAVDYNDYKYVIVNALPSNPDPSMFYLIPES